MSLNLERSTELCALLADASRQRLLALLESYELSVAELTGITGLAQSRVSTHLSRLKTAGLVLDQRSGAQAFYSASTQDSDASEVWTLLRKRLDDAQVKLDRERAEEVIRARKHGQSWAESVAGRMDLHYSPGRTWEATARVLAGLLELGDVLDIGSGDGVFAELIAAHARTVVCADLSPTVTAAARKRLASYANVKVEQADMHALPFEDESFDLVVMMHALTYAARPAAAVAEAARVLRPGGRLLLSSLGKHAHASAVEPFGHVNLGFTQKELQKFIDKAGLSLQDAGTVTRERRPPHFEVVALIGVKE